MSLSNVYSTYEINKLASALAGKFPGGGSVSTVTATEPLIVTNPTTTPNIDLKTGIYLDIDSGGHLDLYISNDPAAGQVLSAVNTTGEMEWIDGGAGTLTEITSDDGVIEITDPKGPAPSLSVNIGKFLNKTGGDLDLDVGLPTTDDYVLSSKSNGKLSWVPQSGGGGGGTGTVTSVAATANGYCAIAGTPTIAPTVGLNVAATGTSGQYLTASGVAGQLAFITPPVAGTVTSVSSADAFIKVTANNTTPEVSLNVGLPANNNEILSSTTAGVLSWTTAGTGTVTSVNAADNFMKVTINNTTPKITLNVDLPTKNNDILASSTTGVLSWITPAAGTVYTGTAPIDISGSDISIGLSNYFEKNGANELDLKVTAAPVDGQILSANAGSLTWVNQPPTLSATLPVVLNSGVISLPISGAWSPTNNVVKSSNSDTLIWGTDGSGGTVTSVIAAYPLEIASGTSTTTPTISLGYNNSFDIDSNNALALKTTIAPVNGYLLSAVGTDGHLNWIEPPASGTGTVTSVAATTDGYCAIAGTPTTAPTVGLNVAGTGTSGQYLTASGVAGQLAFITPPVIPAPLTFSAPLNLTGTAVTLPISGTWESGSSDVVRGSSATSLSWGSGATAGVASINGGAGISVTGSSSVPIVNADIRASSFLQITPNTALLDLNVPACPTDGYVLSSTAGGGTSGNAPAMSWVANATGIYSTPSQTFTMDSQYTVTGVPLTALTMANVIMMIPTGGIGFTAPSGLPAGTQISVTISGFPPAGPNAIANGTIELDGSMVDITNINNQPSTPGTWLFDPSAMTFVFRNNYNSNALGTSFSINTPMLVYTST